LDPRIKNLANILVNYSTTVKPGDWVIIRAEEQAAPLIKEVLRATLRAGANPTLLHPLVNYSHVDTLLAEASVEQLQWESPVEKLVHEKADVFIRISTEQNTRGLSGADAARQAVRQKAQHDLQETRMRRSAAGQMRWVATQYPCSAYAQEADMSLRDYEDFLYAATFADQEDPIGKWQELRERQQKLVDWLAGKREVRVRGPHIDMTLSIEGRHFINADGTRNMPSGEIFTGPVETSPRGWVRFSYPAIRQGRSVEGVELHFDHGRVVKAKSAKNQEYLISQLESDPGARYLGEFAIGTNYGITKFTRNILFDEKIGGTLHMAVGSGYPETGSKNRSAVHWDFICDMREDSEIHVDGELFYRNGQFLID
jgi:aminopeptidase